MDIEGVESSRPKILVSVWNVRGAKHDVAGRGIDDLIANREARVPLSHHENLVVGMHVRIFDEAGLFVGKDQNLFANMVLRWPNDVYVVTAKSSVGSANNFYLLYYFGCGPSEFVTAGDSSARAG